MIPNAQFDAASLAVWTTTGNLSDPEASIAAEAMQLAAHGEVVADTLSDFPPGHPHRALLLWLISSVWHEKRHFFDTCLTNYGARRVRDLFTLSANLYPLLAEAHAHHDPVWFPVEVYGDPVFRLIHGIKEPPDNILQIAHRAKLIKDFTAELDAPSVSGTSIYYLGGEAQLEGLGQVSQLHCVEYSFGVEDAVAITREYVHGMSLASSYRSIEGIAAAFGSGRDDGKGQTRVNPNLSSAIFFTALCGRFFGVGPKPVADLLHPRARLGRLLEEVGRKPRHFEMSEEEAAELVDKAAKRLWGRTAFDEIAADIDAMEAAKVVFRDLEGLDKAYIDFVRLRRRVLATARDLGPASVLPRAFPVVWRDRLRPWHVVATPGGDFKSDGAPVVFGQRLNVPRGMEMVVPKAVTWGRLHASADAAADDVLAPRDREAWIHVLERHAPGAFLMLNGRRHRRMVPPEIERRITEIEGYGIPVRFHPLFEWPEQRDQRSRTNEAVTLAKFSGRRSFTCDITGDEIRPEQAATLTPWEFRRSALLPKFQEAGFVATVKLATDWSDWIVRRDLLKDTAV